MVQYFVAIREASVVPAHPEMHHVSANWRKYAKQREITKSTRAGLHELSI